MKYPIPAYNNCKRGIVDQRKDDLMRFFNSLTYDITAAGYVLDEVTGEYTDLPEVAVVLDGFGISNKDAYHFEKYDYVLSLDFREYALAHL